MKFRGLRSRVSRSDLVKLARVFGQLAAVTERRAELEVDSAVKTTFHFYYDGEFTTLRRENEAKPHRTPT